MDNAIEDFSLVSEPFYQALKMVRTRSFLYLILYILAGIFNKTFSLLPLFGYEMIIANSPLRASLAIYLTIIPWARVGYEIIITNSAELIDSQGGA